MKAAYDPAGRSLTQINLLSRFTSATFIRVASLIVLVGLLASTFYYPSSASSETAISRFKSVSISIAGAIEGAAVASDLGIPSIATSNTASVSAMTAMLLSETVEIGTPAEPRPTGCNNAAVWCLGETVPVVVTGAPLRPGFRERRIQWVAPDGTVPHLWTVDENVENDSYTLETLGAFAQVGTWQVRTINNRGGGVVVTTFEVGDPSSPSVDLALSMTGSSEVTANSNTSYSVTVNNLGPDDAENVVVVNPVPANTTFFSASEVAGFTCVTPAVGESGEIVCTGASLPNGEDATFVFTFTANSTVTNGSSVYNVAKTDSSTNEPITSNNYADIYASSAPGGAPGDCQLNCPLSINAVANTTNESNQRGANVTFDSPVANGECGAVTLSHNSGSFFPVGTTTVTATSAENGGSCSFTITVEDQGEDPPTISCPANPAPANADSNCSAGVNVGTPTTTGSNVTLFAIRSDGRPMYTCDANGNCTRTATDDPFQAGTTTITWFAYAHDEAGPYTTPGDGEGDTFEEQHRTGTASCTQTVVVNDVTAPSITPPANQTASADASCQFTVPDYTSSANVADNCACASSNESEACQDRQPITISQSPAPGTVVGLGPLTITLTANDGSSNNNGEGNTATAQFTVTVVDDTPPAITCPSNIVVYLPLNSTDTSAVVTYTAPTGTDNCSGATTTQTAGLASGSAFPMGTTTNTFTVTDGANNSTSCSFTVTVLYNFTGFFSPVNNPPVLNNVNAGKALPLKFSLSGYKGLDIFAAGYPMSQQIACDSSAPLADVEGTTTSGGSTLTYNPDQYHYNWKTESSWAGTCRQLIVRLNDGTDHIALFKFK